MDSLKTVLGGKDAQVYLNGHSGGGSFIFGYLAGMQTIPSYIRRISWQTGGFSHGGYLVPELDDGQAFQSGLVHGLSTGR